jgi:hypothetical protein
MKLARWVFTAAGVYGVLVMLPQLFLEDRISRENPPPITHPEYFYGFMLVTLAWQLAFLVIGRDPVRFRQLMPVAVFEKLPFAVTMYAMVGSGRVGGAILPFATIDVVLGLLFALSYWRTSAAQSSPAPATARSA